MGWLRPGPVSSQSRWGVLSSAFGNRVSDTQEPLGQKYTPAPLETPDSHIRFIPKSEVQRHCPAPSSPPLSSNDGLRSTHARESADPAQPPPLWLIIDDIIYDCTDFVHEHPGGTQVIESFSGQDCSWQFWRFHGPEHLQQYGAPLRVGRTAGFKNRFEEQPRWVGLRPLGVNEDWNW